MKDLFAVLCPDGALSYDDLTQCQNERWISIATLRNDEKVTAICFEDSEIARKFIRRNYPRDWARGVVALSRGEIEWMDRQGWKIQINKFPNLYRDRQEFGFEILEFQSKPDLFAR